VMDELGIERARWVGHDWGSFAGFHAMFDNLDRFERFMPLSMPHPWPPDGPPDPRRLLRLWYQVLIASPVLGPLAIRRGFPVQALRKSRKAGRWTDEELELYGDDMEVEYVEGAAHWLPEEKPEDVLQRAFEFLP